jgi:NAD(P)-dependent dehydrogenase (short-subunit alcohol dehydrogenase family)
MSIAKDLAGARVLVTGASAGIGRAVAIGAVREGARVMMVARRQKELNAAVAEAGGGEALAVDLTEAGADKRLSMAITSALGGLDVVISCVGVAPLQMMIDTSDAHWEQVITTNLVSTHRLLRSCVPLLGGSGTFIALSSDSVHRPRSGLGAYAASKAALERTVYAWRTEHPWLRFTTVTISDTFPTDFANGFDLDILTRLLDDWAIKGLAQGRFMAADDVAQMLLSVAATMTALPGIGVDHLTIRSPSPTTASFMDAFTALSETAEGAQAAEALSATSRPDAIGPGNSDG